MTRIEESARTKRALGRRGAGPPRRTTPVGSGRLTAALVRDAVDEAERLICGAAAVGTAAAAEGMALGGRAAATLLGARSAEPVAGRPSAQEGAWVHHRIGGGPADGFAFELVAGGPQEAVDHCLVAHALASTLGRPGLCSLDARLASALEVVRLPDPSTLTALARCERPTGPPGRGAEAVQEAASTAFSTVSEATGRTCAAVVTRETGDAQYVVVCSGAPARGVFEAVSRLRESGIRCGAVEIALVRPFPARDLVGALSGARSVAVVDRGGMLVAAVRGALGGEARASVVAVEEAPPNASWDAALTDAWGVALERAEPSPQQTPKGDERPCVVAVRPSGPWGEGLLLDALAIARSAGTFGLDWVRTVDGRGLELAPSTTGRVAGAPRAAADLVVAGDPAITASSGLAGCLREGGTLLVVACGQRPETWWSSVSPRTRADLLARRPVLTWFDLASVDGLDPSDEGAVRASLLGAVLGALAEAAAPTLGVAREALVDAGAAELVASAGAPAADWLRKGAAEVVSRPLETIAREAGTTGREPDEKRALPRMPAGPPADPDYQVRAAAREFHVTGRGCRSAAEPTPGVPLVPLALAAFGEERAPWRSYPLVVLPASTPAPDGGVLPVDQAVDRAVAAVASKGEDVSIVVANRARLAQVLGALVAERGGHARVDGLLDEAMIRFRDAFDLSSAGASALADQCARLGAELGSRLSGAELVGFDPATSFRLYAAAAKHEREPRRAALVAEIRSLVQTLENLLRIDAGHGPEGTKPDTLATTLGEAARALVDLDSLSRTLPSSRGPVRLGAERRARIEHALATLRSHEAKLSRSVLVHVVRAASEVEVDSGVGVAVVDHEDAMRAAVGLFDAIAIEAADLFRVLRVARLEADGSYDPDVHDRVLARFQWQSMTTEELLTLPAVVVVESERRLRGGAMGAFSEFLRSGRPVHVLVAQGTSDMRAGESWEARAGYHPGLGYVAVAHREPFVLESSLGRVAHLTSGLRRLAGALRPAVALVATPSWDATTSPWLQLAVAHEARAVPCFSYDVEAGPHWAERFDLSDNPQPERIWPEHAIAVVGPEGSETIRAEAFTFAHAVALDPAYREHFRIVAPEAWSSEQMEIDDYLAAPRGATARRVPYLWVVTGDGVLARALVTRELAFACRDRMRAWRILQELAGTDDEYARRAADKARREALEEAGRERAALEATHAETIDRVRREAAGEAIDRLVQVLLGVGSLPAGQPLPVSAPQAEAPTARPAEALEARPPSPVPAVEEEEAVAFNEPYIDSVLCTTCQDCININPRMFKYDANKQAFITDPALGTFEELVRAAEKCPARCIHPGVPRPADASATDELVARAAKFN